ncbi:TlpA disulfide reductase family protein [Methylomarinum sp. Ch1-1]|uniref:TlpA disulfide reductase family protein n=1 Tax=Methylomarinum roseum TaxID=3067653 RepID=A0AAU7NZ79_9GAMM|nr:TlpA disulfide reductase family protein [Methylomarinum sp. Ch1-1]MDP4521614.1 TlpA disulfide reductase family protein [Methylomarinum sp. Ch1-1]
MKNLTLIFCLLSSLFTPLSQGGTLPLQPFGPGSYQTILEQQQNRPLMLVLWSLTCSSCMKEMGMLKKISDRHPELTIVLISVDDYSEAEQVRAMLQKNQLSEMNNWLFSVGNSAQLRYQIDPTWYGELPRTYFYDAAHDRTAVSGVLSAQDYERLIADILP